MRGPPGGEVPGGLVVGYSRLDRTYNKADTMVMNNRRLRGKDYLGCLIQVITVLAGIFSIVQGISWLIKGR
jgi:hypothetical protein